MRKFTAAFAFAAIFAVIANAAETGTKLVLFTPGTTAEQRRSQIEALGGKLIADYEFINESLADFSNRAAGDIRAAIRAGRAPNASDVQDNQRRKWLNGSAYGSFPTPAQIAGRASVRIDAGDMAAPAFSEARPADSAADAKIPWGIARVGAKAAWAKGLDGSGVKVGIVDTGIDLKHPDLSGNIAATYNAVNHTNNGADDQGHGTHVAGTVAGMGAGSDGVFGVAPKAKIYAAKVLGADGQGDDSAVVDGINWTIGQHVKVINMSLGGPEDVPAFHQAVKAAADAGIAVVCAAGNDYGAAVSYPAAYPEAIAISASTSGDGLAFFSSVGPQIAFIAPGAQIYSTKNGGGYTTMDGTSMASPHMAGLAALAVQAGASDGKAVRDMLKAAASKLPRLSQDEQGAGLVDAGKIGK
ncbi:MAG: S8 family peptidase [Elusimicrobiales bacterium]